MNIKKLKDDGSCFDKLIGKPPLSKVERYISRLNTNGVFIFECPPDLDKLEKVILKLHPLGAFTEFEMDMEKIICTFKKNETQNTTVLVNGSETYLNITDTCATLTDTPRVDDLFYVYENLEPSCKEVFQHPKGNYYVLTNINGDTERYIFLPEYPSKICVELDKHLEKHKADLMMYRYENWHRWDPYDKVLEFEQHYGKECIYIDKATDTRCVRQCMHFTNNLICLVPKSGVVPLDLKIKMY
jgi:hypothetical protein